MHISFLVFTVWELLWCFAQKDLECLSKMCEETASRKFWEFTPREIKLTTVKSFFWHRRNCFYHNCWTAEFFFSFFSTEWKSLRFFNFNKKLFSKKTSGFFKEEGKIIIKWTSPCGFLDSNIIYGNITLQINAVIKSEVKSMFYLHS